MPATSMLATGLDCTRRERDLGRRGGDGRYRCGSTPAGTCNEACPEILVPAGADEAGCDAPAEFQRHFIPLDRIQYAHHQRAEDYPRGVLEPYPTQVQGTQNTKPETADQALSLIGLPYSQEKRIRKKKLSCREKLADCAQNSFRQSAKPFLTTNL